MVPKAGVGPEECSIPNGNLTEKPVRFLRQHSSMISSFGFFSTKWKFFLAFSVWHASSSNNLWHYTTRRHYFRKSRVQHLKLYVIHSPLTMEGEFPTEMWRPSRTVCAPAPETSARSDALTDCVNCIGIVRNCSIRGEHSQNLLFLSSPVLTLWILSQASHGQ